MLSSRAASAVRVSAVAASPLVAAQCVDGKTSAEARRQRSAGSGLGVRDPQRLPRNRRRDTRN